MPNKGKRKVEKHSSHRKSPKDDSRESSKPQGHSKKIPKQEATLIASNITGLTPNHSSSSISAGTTASGLPKNFRSHPDIENFFRFIYENDLREEALVILEEVVEKKLAKKAAAAHG